MLTGFLVEVVIGILSREIATVCTDGEDDIVKYRPRAIAWFREHAHPLSSELSLMKNGVGMVVIFEVCIHAAAGKCGGLEGLLAQLGIGVPIGGVFIVVGEQRAVERLQAS